MNRLNFEELINDYHPMIYKICRVYSDSVDFDDLYQEVLINLWNGLKNFKAQSKISTWLYRVALNTALTYHRDEKKHKNRVSFEYAAEPVDSGSDAAEREQRIEQLYAAVRQLKREDRSLMLLYLEENTYEEISEITGLSISNVGVRVNRIKKKLFQLLNNEQNG